MTSHCPCLFHFLTKFPILVVRKNDMRTYSLGGLSLAGFGRVGLCVGFTRRTQKRYAYVLVGWVEFGWVR